MPRRLQCEEHRVPPKAQLAASQPFTRAGSSLPARAIAPSFPVPAAFWQTTGLLLLSNVFMTFAWYGHLKFKNSLWWVAALASWGIALAEYLCQVPANRIGHNGGFSVAQLKILQEVITLSMFVPFALLYLGEKPRLDYLWAGLCMCGAVYFIFRGGNPAAS